MPLYVHGALHACAHAAFSRPHMQYDDFRAAQVFGLRAHGTAAMLCCAAVQDENGEELYHALGAVEGHEGEASLRVRFKLTDAAQAGNARGLQRYVAAGMVLEGFSP